MITKPNLDWTAIDTLMFDMDGTLLDLHFDNYFWFELIPRSYANKQQISEDESRERLLRLMKQHEGEISWYCTDFWETTLQLDIMQLKESCWDKIAIRPQVTNFLTAAKAKGKRLLLVTNAHRDSLNLKMRKTGLAAQFDALISSHDFGIPKEKPLFWEQLNRSHTFDPLRSVLFDDNQSVLNSAEQYGIKHLVCIHQPDSQQPNQIIHKGAAIHHFDELLPISASS